MSAYRLAISVGDGCTNADKALATIRESNGLAVCVTGEEILAMQRLLGMACGVTGTAAMKKACKEGLSGKNVVNAISPLANRCILNRIWS